MVFHFHMFYCPVVTRWKKVVFLTNWRGHLTILLRKIVQERSSFFSFSILFHSIQTFLRTKRSFACFYLVCIFRKKSSVFFFFWKKFSHSWKTISFFFFHQVFLASFFHHFLFLSITFRIHHCFSFPFLLDVFIFLNSFFLSSVSLPAFSSVFFEQQFLLPSVSKSNLVIVPFTCILFLCMSSFCSSICSAVVSSILVSITFVFSKLAFGTSAIFVSFFLCHFWHI